MANSTRKKEVSGTTPEGNGPTSAGHSTQAASKRPIWSRTLNRVDCSIWKHDQDNGPRYTISISRSYFHQRSNQWKRDSYFDRRDLVDVIAVCNEAEAHIQSLQSMTEIAGKE